MRGITDDISRHVVRQLCALWIAHDCNDVIGKSMAAEDVAAWLAGRNPDRRILYASYSESLGMRMSLNLQRMMMSTKYREVFPHMRVGLPGWTTNTTLTEFPGFDGSFRATTINGEITGFGIDLGIRSRSGLTCVGGPSARRGRANTLIAISAAARVGAP
jgi:hypothetical protein